MYDEKWEGGRAGDLGRIGVVVMYDTSSTFKFSVV